MCLSIETFSRWKKLSFSQDSASIWTSSCSNGVEDDGPKQLLSSPLPLRLWPNGLVFQASRMTFPSNPFSQTITYRTVIRFHTFDVQTACVPRFWLLKVKPNALLANLSARQIHTPLHILHAYSPYRSLPRSIALFTILPRRLKGRQMPPASHIKIHKKHKCHIFEKKSETNLPLANMQPERGSGSIL